jgi:uncharacterized protein (DUF1501 family)
MNRRKFLRYSALSSALTTGFTLGKIPVWAANPLDITTPEDNVLVIIQMFGGNDALNTIIPADNDLYYSKYRKKLFIPKAKAIRLSNTSSFMNPALKTGKNEGFYGLFKEGNLAVIQGIGYPEPDLSHFRSTDIWLSGIIPENDSQRLESGWLGRYFNKKNAGVDQDYPSCMNIGDNSSLLFQSGQKNMGISVENPNEFYERGKDILSGETTTSGNSSYVNEKNFIYDLSLQSNVYSKVVKKAFDAGKNALEYNKGKLSDELKLVGRLISGGLKTKVYLLSIDGFDTHANQGTTDGKHAELLTQISEAVGSFMADLKAQNIGKKVIGITVSEFGRRPNENDSNGSDHGAAGVMFAFGESINGKVYGKTLGFDKLDENNDFIYQYDYRAVYDEVLSKWFGADSQLTSTILTKRFNPIEDGLLSAKSKIILANEPVFKNTVFPNPTTDGLMFLKLNASGLAPLVVNQIDSLGRKTELIPAIPTATGIQEIPIQLKGSKGIYLVEIIDGNNRDVKRVVWV